MKTLYLEIDATPLKLTGDDAKRPVQELYGNVVKNVILGWAQQNRRDPRMQGGLAADDRKKFYKICDLFDVAIKDKAKSIELEDDISGFIKKCFREIVIQPDLLLRMVEETLMEDLNKDAH